MHLSFLKSGGSSDTTISNHTGQTVSYAILCFCDHTINNFLTSWIIFDQPCKITQYSTNTVQNGIKNDGEKIMSEKTKKLNISTSQRYLD